MGVAAVVVIVVILVALAIAKARHFNFAAPVSSGCLVHGAKLDVPLDAGQAALAATIAGVATHRVMPERAVTIAYAAALQESDLANLSYGDRDSVGVFQQRPSQGWGTRRQLLDPVYASTRFFAALAAVPDYRRLRVYQAAQAVQHSADGQAYSQYVPQGAAMADGFSGRLPHAVWCWYGAPIRGTNRLAEAETQLRRTFGHLQISRSGDPVARVHVRTVAGGWTVAAWLVSHAVTFKLRRVIYQGYQWSSAHGRKGWTAARPAGASPAHASRLGLAFG